MQRMVGTNDPIAALQYETEDLNVEQKVPGPQLYYLLTCMKNPKESETLALDERGHMWGVYTCAHCAMG